MTERTRRHFSNEQKAALIRRHVIDKIPVSEICEQEKIQPSVYYKWMRDLFANAASAFEPPKRSSNRERQAEERIAYLEAKLKKKDEVIAEVTEEMVKIKKELGEP
jgi:transposase-like protein